MLEGVRPGEKTAAGRGKEAGTGGAEEARRGEGRGQRWEGWRVAQGGPSEAASGRTEEAGGGDAERSPRFALHGRPWRRSFDQTDANAMLKWRSLLCTISRVLSRAGRRAGAVMRHWQFGIGDLTHVPAISWFPGLGGAQIRIGCICFEN